MTKKVIGKLVIGIFLAFSLIVPASLLAQEVAVPEKLGVDLDGNVFNLKEHLGKENLYLVFWATWCGACEDEIPNLIKTHNTVKEVNLIAVNPGINDSVDRARRYKDKHHLPYKIVFDESGNSAHAFGVAGVPMAILINKSGEVIYAGYPPPSTKVAEIFSKS